MATFSLCSHSRENNQALGDLFLCGCWLMALSLWPHLNLVTSQRSHLPILPHWGLRLQHYDFWGDTIQSIGPNKFLKSENVSNENLGQNVGSCFWIFLLSRRWISQVLGILETLGPHFCLLKSMLLLNAQPFCSMFFLCVCVCVILQIPEGAELCRLLSSHQYVSLLYGILVKF